MKWFLDTEFDEDGKTIELISIGLVSEHGDQYYAVSSEFDEGHCNDWVKLHVLPKLGGARRSTRREIAQHIQQMLGTEAPEFWGYYADYDWVVFCQLYGRMVDLPAGYPQYCNDVKQLMHAHGIVRSQLPSEGNEHNALSDALWTRMAYLRVLEIIAHPRPLY